MNSVNYYPVTLRDFERVKSVGNYVVTYCILDDRIHMEIALDNSVFATQSFKETLKKSLPINYKDNPMKFFIKKYLTSQTSYRYYPTPEQVKELKKIKLYSKLIVQKFEEGTELDKDKDKIIESDDEVRIYNDEKVIMIASKVE